MAAGLSEVALGATAWMDRAWDAEAGLLWNGPGAYDDVADGPHTVHLVRETSWYAVGLLLRGAPGDRARAERALHAVLDHQYDAPAQPWHGTFVRFPEWPAPQAGAVEWIDYDPNWRQFIGTTLAVAVTDLDLSPGLVDRARDAIRLAVTAEPPDRVPPTYANIALMRAWLEAWDGSDDASYARAIADAFDRHGCFVEHNSPTYYGVDLLALRLWQRPDSRVDLQRLGAKMDQALWTDIGRWWHAGLGNLCGPYSRAYGMDMHAYVSGLALVLRCAGLSAPLPDPSVEPLPHGHDLCKAPLLDHLGMVVPDGARADFDRFRGPHFVEQVIDDAPRRVATGWLDDDLLVGAEASSGKLHARGQYHPATAHWRLPQGGIGWLRLRHHGPASATASERRLDVECRAHHREGPQLLRWETNAEPLEVRDDRWTLPGLDVAVSTDAALAEAASLTYQPTRELTRITLTFR